MLEIWQKMTPPLNPDHIVKLALGVKKAKDLQFSKWETILSEIIVGDSFGVDRIDYLLRDSHHTGVGYGKFDHYRLVDEIRILPTETDSTEPGLGIMEGGIYSAEALARYFMFSQVYYHPVRLIYDRHLMDFLKAWMSDDSWPHAGRFPISSEEHLRLTDCEVLVAIQIAASDSGRPGHDAARRISEHKHFKVLYERNPQDARIYSNPGSAIEGAASRKFKAQNIRSSKPRHKNVSNDFPVRTRDGRIVSAISMSNVLQSLKPTAIDYVYIEPKLLEAGSQWLEKRRKAILKKAAEKEESE